MKELILNSLFILVLTEHVHSQGIKMPSHMYAKGTYVNCVANPEYVKNISCKLKAKSWEHSVAYLDGDLVGYVRNVTIRLESFKYTNQFRPFLINITFNYCEMFKNGHVKNPYLQAIMNSVFKYSNLKHSCPYFGHLYVHGGFVDLVTVPFFIPLGTYKLLINFFDGWPLTWLGTVTYVFQIGEKQNGTRTRFNERRTFLTEDTKN